MLTENEAAEFRIRRVAENWALFRDAGNWDAFATVWHDDGWMTATWFQGPATDFIKASRQAFDAGVNILHFLGGSSCEISGARAIAQTKMTIQQRAPVHGILVDATCTGRFYDFLEKRGEVWAIVRRQPVYEKDRLDPVAPGATVELDADLLNSYPEGYRYLAYLQVQAGYPVKANMPGLLGPEVEALYSRGAAWLAGDQEAF